MDKYLIVKRIEDFAPLDTQEAWDASGWAVETDNKDVHKIMLCLTVTQDVINQAKRGECDMIVSHHPLFSVPMEWKDIDIYCAHTNFDRAQGGTTDVLVNNVIEGEFKKFNIIPHPAGEGVRAGEQSELYSDGRGGSYLRYIDVNIKVDELLMKLRKISPNLRYVNNNNVDELKRIAFCAGSGSEFIQEAVDFGADAFVTGDIKFHTALESPIVLFDIGHFESEIISLKVFEGLIGCDAEVIFAKEKSPFKY